MSRFVQGADRRQQTLLPECLDDYVTEDNPVRVVDVFVDELDLRGLGTTNHPTRRPRCRGNAEQEDLSAVLDMPGMGELQLTRALEGITDAFADVSASAGQCRYNTASLGDRKSGGKPCTRQSGRSRSRTGSRT